MLFFNGNSEVFILFFEKNTIYPLKPLPAILYDQSPNMPGWLKSCPVRNYLKTQTQDLWSRAYEY
jgi:hypothetical protein